jgi:hypothetical protein
MKPKTFKSDKDAASIKGNLSVEEIVKADWERNYKAAGIPLDTARLLVKEHVDDNQPIYRMRNTIFLITPENGFDDVLFHTITADPIEVYKTMLMMFFLGLNADQGTETVYTYVDDKKMYRSVRPMYKEYIDIEPADDGDEQGKYLLTVDIAGFVANARQIQAAQRG